MSELIVKISGDAKNLSNEYKKVSRQTEDLEKQIGAATKASAAAFVGFAGAIGLAANEASKLETIGVQFEVLTGSAEKAKKTVEELTDFAAKTPFQFEDIAKAGQQLLGFGFQAEELQEKLRGIGDVSAAVGAPLNDLTLIFGQVRAAGKLTGERLLQLQERAVPIGPALAETLGVAETSIKDLVSKGKVDFATFEKAFASISEKGGLAFDGMAKRSETLGGVISTLKDNFSLLAADIGKQFLPVLKSFATGITSVIQFIRENPVFASMAGKVLALGAGLTGLVTVLGTAGLAFLKIRAAMLAAQVSTISLGVAVKSLVGATGIGLLIIVAAEVFARWDTIWKGAKKIFGSFSEDTLDKIQLITAAFVPPLGAIIFFARNWEEIWTTSRDIFFFFFDSTIKWIAVLKTAFTSFANFMKNIGGSLASILEGAFSFDFGKIKEGLEGLKNTIKDGVGNIRDEIQKELNEQDKQIELRIQARAEKQIETGDETEAADPVEKTKKIEKMKTAAVDAETQKRIDALKNEREVLKLQREEASAEEIDFLKRRQEIRDADRDAREIKNEEERNLALQNIQTQREILDEQESEYLERKREEDSIRKQEELLATEEFNNLSLEKQKEFQNKLSQENKRAREAENKNKSKAIGAQNRLDQQRQNAAVGFAKATGDAIISLTGGSSKASLLLSKAFAVADVFVRDAQARAAATAAAASASAAAGPAAPAVFASTLAGFQTTISTNTGLALGTIAAQTVSALAANQGGIVPLNFPGARSGVDSVPALLTPGELVVPQSNFDEVVRAVANQRNPQGNQGTNAGESETENVVIEIDVKERASEMITLEQREGRTLGLINE